MAKDRKEYQKEYHKKYWKKYREINREKIKAYRKIYNQLERTKKLVKEWRTEYRKTEEFKFKRKARYTAYNALKYGKIIKEPCAMCGSNENIEIHHIDYSKPMLITFLCRNCHMIIHGRIKTDNKCEV
jgi:hypothetical protein